jgi:hypothetical protein
MKLPSLIAGWQRSYRLTTMQAAALVMLFSLLQTDVLPMFKFTIPPAAWPWVTGGFAATIAVLRVLAQPGVLDPKPKDGA